MDNILNKLFKSENKILKYIKGIISVSISVQIVIMPIMMYSYKTISFSFLITSVLTTALISLIIILGFIIIIISFPLLEFANVLGIFYKLLLSILLFITEFSSKLPFSKIYIKTPYVCQIVLYYILMLVFFYLIKINQLKRLFKYKKQFISVVLIIILITNLVQVIPQGKLNIYFIDVGQGDACLIITPNNNTILIDGGGSETYDVGKNIILPYLMNRRVNKLDYIICSHFDTDHVRAGYLVL